MPNLVSFMMGSEMPSARQTLAARMVRLSKKSPAASCACAVQSPQILTSHVSNNEALTREIRAGAGKTKTGEQTLPLAG